MGFLNLFGSTEKSITKTYKLDPKLDLERDIAKQIYDALQGPIMEAVLQKLPSSNVDAYWRSNMEGNSLKVEKAILGDIYELCQEVKEKLGYKEKVDFYVTGDASVNAFSVASESSDEPNIVNINSGLFTLMSREELKFVIGHELGHLVNRDTALSRLINFVFPSTSHPPISLLHKIRLHEQLAELVADRYGYIANENLGACVTAFYKLTSGLDLGKMNVSIDALLEENQKHLDYFLKDKGISRSTHPVTPIRIQALTLFATAPSQQKLQEGMDELTSILLKLGDGELDEYTAQFMATAGLIAANADGQVTKEELDQIIDGLSEIKIFPRNYLDEIASGDVMKTFSDAVTNILRINPGMRDSLLNYLIVIVMVDQNIDQKEIDLIYQFGSELGFSEIEVAQAIAASVQARFTPSIDAIC